MRRLPAGLGESCESASSDVSRGSRCAGESFSSGSSNGAATGFLYMRMNAPLAAPHMQNPWPLPSSGSNGLREINVLADRYDGKNRQSCSSQSDECQRSDAQQACRVGDGGRSGWRPTTIAGEMGDVQWFTILRRPMDSWAMPRRTILLPMPRRSWRHLSGALTRQSTLRSFGEIG